MKAGLAKKMGLVLLVVLGLVGVLAAQDQGVREAGEEEAKDRQFVVNLVQESEWAYAYEEAQAYLGRYPAGVFADEMLFALGRIGAKTGKPKEGQAALEELAKTYPQSPYREEGRYLLGLGYLEAKSYQKALETLEALVRDYPTSAFFPYQPMGRAKVGLKDFAGAVVLFKKGLEKTPQDLSLQLDLAWATEWAGQTQAANKRFAALLKEPIDPDQKAKISFQLGVDRYQAKDYAGAYGAYKDQWTRWPLPELNQTSRFWSARSVLAWGNAAGPERQKEALWLFEENLKAPKPMEPIQTLRGIGWLQEQLGLLAEAQGSYGRLQTLDPVAGQDAALALHRAELAQTLGDPAQAKMILLAALGRVKGETSPLEARLWTYLQTSGDCAGLLDRAKKRTLAGAAAQEGNLSLGHCLFAAKRYKEALKAYGQLDANWAPQAFANQLAALEALKSYLAAVRLLDQALTDLRYGPRPVLLETQLRLKLAAKDPLVITWGEQQLAAEPELAKQGGYLLLLGQAHRQAQKPNRRRAEELLALAQTRFSRVSEKLSVLEQRRQLLEGDDRGLISLYQEASLLEPEPQKKLALGLEITKLKLKVGEEAPELEALSSEPGAVGAEALALKAELKIGKKDYLQAVALLDQGLAKKPPSPLETRLRFRKAQVLQAAEDWHGALAEYRQLSKTKNPYSRQSAKQAKAIEAYLGKP
ncbi:MAG: hypothetical protein A2600_06505 [Candidatus Lambdaproteobacteria bacterium RIFOXYD1_FULL_56_27]|uniref:Outer membrane lipoprotein BamD-like domain-containing protein n=1 Tax=Candidatus Lambdaproteobacteria bacterium RIFOXYD2_FULL_56_26 TaxID=1817773 RepID=A0A1F6H0C9_9PROT|nr:MAG: hypothetical protein A2426_05920 [Candidatus Lambdaproteobacteria bacterium RIFOXYC1_FULL_56_13]OGH03858.1 MAG: hypothetical protein A2557_12015 [Candidatus Lambdaproteobacteria bacterium RIFOXYD2_FULL_56_26]OGH08986.1 MAG: hypothetical protein A2600_06505 [Candidatus Lambdaproteobacteria bacterium RIFOXYD1_FULL_56_27]